jgi:hypothetical protein
MTSLTMASAADWPVRRCVIAASRCPTAATSQARTHSFGINGNRPRALAAGERAHARKCFRARDAETSSVTGAASARGSSVGVIVGTVQRETRRAGRSRARFGCIQLGKKCKFNSGGSVDNA